MNYSGWFFTLSVFISRTITNYSPNLKMRFITIAISLVCFWMNGIGQIIQSDSISIHFISEAPLEVIKATNHTASGILDLETNRFAFKVFINNFKGFNNELQRVHFMENYLESTDFPISTFQGRILNPNDIKDEGKSLVKVKGILNIHGVKDERIIEVLIEKSNDSSVIFDSTFNVLLVDHDINIPRIVTHKISESILVNVFGELN